MCAFGEDVSSLTIRATEGQQFAVLIANELYGNLKRAHPVLCRNTTVDINSRSSHLQNLWYLYGRYYGLGA